MSALSASEPLTLEDMYAGFKAARERMYAAARRVPQPPAVVAIRMPERHPAPLPPCVPSGIEARQILIGRGLSSRHAFIVAGIIIPIASAYGVTPVAVLGDRRTGALSKARHEAIAGVAAWFPHWSLPRIGLAFDRDHTSVLHGLRRAGAWPRRPG